MICTWKFKHMQMTWYVSVLACTNMYCRCTFRYDSICTCIYTWCMYRSRYKHWQNKNSVDSVTHTLTTTTHNLESWYHDVSHLPGLLHVLSGGLCYHAMLATTVISSPWVGVHLDADEAVLNSEVRITPKTDQTSNAVYTGILRTSYVSVTSGL